MRRVLPYGSGALLSPATRGRLVVAVLISVVLAALEVAGLLGIALLLQLLTGGSVGTGALGKVGDLTGADDRSSLTLLIVLVVMACFVVKGVAAIVFRRWMVRFIARQESETASVLLDSYLHAPYALHQRRNTGDLLRTMYDGLSGAYSMVISSLLGVVPDALTVLAIVVLLLVATPVAALGAVLFLVLSGVGLQRWVRGHADRAGAEMTEAGAQAYILTLQSLGGIKEIQVRRNADYFVERFGRARERQALARATSQFLAEMPRYALELVFVVAVVIVTGLTVLTSGSAQESLTAVGLFVAAGFRLLPSLVRVVGAVTTVRIGQPSLALVIEDLAAAAELPSRPDDRDRPRTPLRRQLEVSGVGFRYPGSSADVLSDVTFTVPAGTSLAFVGSSGAGKSTLLDLVLGLHRPGSGDIRVDGVSVLDDLASWQRSLGLVPQDVFLLDDTIAANVAFGVPADEIDHALVLACIARAQLDEFVDALPEGLETVVGERGSRISGGQRQRIGIARALYAEPDLLVLDEATSALDNETEARVAETIAALSGELTMIVVAHRLSTVRTCDRVAFMEQGRVVAVDTFDALRRDNEAFARLVSLGALG